MSENTEKNPVICDHCGGPIAIRNPTGKCDHLHYPENCLVCSGKKKRDEEAQLIERNK